MHSNPNIKRWGLFRMDESRDVVRRYQLARLEEVALAFPVQGTEPARRRRPSGGGSPLREPGVG